MRSCNFILSWVERPESFQPLDQGPKLELFFYEKTDVSPLLMSKAEVVKYNFKEKH